MLFKIIFQVDGTHKVVHVLKFVLRAEGPRDYVDLLLSMKHQPNVVIIDMAHMVAAHGNIRKPGMFAPFEGWATAANIQEAQDGGLNVDMPWLLDFYNEQPVVISRSLADHSFIAVTRLFLCRHLEPGYEASDDTHMVYPPTPIHGLSHIIDTRTKHYCNSKMFLLSVIWFFDII